MIINTVLKDSKNLSDTLLVPLFKEDLKDFNHNNTDILDNIALLINRGDFQGSLGEIESFNLLSTKDSNRAIVLGLGSRSDFELEGLRAAISKVISEVNRLKSKSLEIPVIGDVNNISKIDIIRVITEISILSNYSFDKYKEKKSKTTLENINILCEKENIKEVSVAVKEGEILGKSTTLARDLVNEPANVLLPIELGNRVKEIGRESGFEVSIFDEEKIKELGMKAYLEVTRASDNPPRFIVMRYFGDEDNKEEITGLVGKGLTYDSGGLSIKTKQGMLNMKCDMGGAASVIGAMKAIAELNLKVNVIAVIAACENMISGSSYRPGDVIESMGGKTIFIGSTDAEGRLTLIDAVYYIIEYEGVNRVLDIATLTGSAARALGSAASPVISNDDIFFNELYKASKISGEKIWRMPIFDEYKEQLKSNIADLTNSAGVPGMMTAGLFIGEFVGNIPWIHMDIAGTAWSSKSKKYIKEGGTGVGVRTLYHLVKNMDK